MVSFTLLDCGTALHFNKNKNKITVNLNAKFRWPTFIFGVLQFSLNLSFFTVMKLNLKNFHWNLPQKSPSTKIVVCHVQVRIVPTRFAAVRMSTPHYIVYFPFWDVVQLCLLDVKDIWYKCFCAYIPYMPRATFRFL